MILKRGIVVLFFLIFSSVSFAQLTAPDFTLTDIDGNTRNLYSETAQGKTVVLEFFSVFCGTCITNTPVVENIWTTYGYSGDSMWVWAIEYQGVVDSVVNSFRQTYGVTFPMFGTSNDDVVVYLYDILYVPQYMVVCPDNSMKPYSISNLEEGVQACMTTTEISAQSNSSEMKVYSRDQRIVFENTGNKPFPGMLQIASLIGQTENHLLNLEPGAKKEILINDAGMFVYSLINTENGKVKNGKIRVE